jgi:hypothetical protein
MISHRNRIQPVALPAYLSPHARQQSRLPERRIVPMKTFNTVIKAASLAAILLAAPAAFASEWVDPALKEKVAAKLKAEGYDVRKVQMEDGKVEVYAVKDGKAMEIYLDDKLNVVKMGGEDSEG